MSVHVHLTPINNPDYFTRRDLPCPPELKNARYGATYRLAHINMCLAMRDVVRAAGPSPDGARAEVFYEVESLTALEELLRDDPYVIGKVWTAWTARPLVHVVPPAGLVDVCLDGSRRITVVEGKVADGASTVAALRRLRNEEALAIGGVTDDGMLIAWVREAEPAAAVKRLAASRADVRGTSSRPLVWVL